MRSQKYGARFALGALLAAIGCGKATDSVVSGIYPPTERPDLVLRDVAFARLTEGRLAARGTAVQVEYRRAGGHLVAAEVGGRIEPDPATSIARLGTLVVSTPLLEGDVGARRGEASGGVKLVAARGDTADARTVEWEGAAGLLRSNEPVAAQGPGYAVQGRGMVARDDGSRIDLIHGTRGRLEVRQ